MPCASPAGCCRSPATCASVAATSWRATPAARSPPANLPSTSLSRGSSAVASPGSTSGWMTPTDGPGTRLRLEHVALVDHLDQWDEFGPGAVGVGWDLSLLGLAEHLATGEPVRADLVDPGAIEFMRAASAAWGVASTAAGTPVAQAEAAAAPPLRHIPTADARLRRARRPGATIGHRAAGRRRAHGRRADRRRAATVRHLPAGRVTAPAGAAESGFVHVRVDGARRRYSLDPTPLREAHSWLDRFGRFWEQRLDALGTEIDRGRRRPSRTDRGQ